MNHTIPNTTVASDPTVEEFLESFMPILARQCFQAAMGNVLRQHGFHIFEIDIARHPMVLIRIVVPPNASLGRGRRLRRKIRALFRETGYPVLRNRLRFGMDLHDHLSIYAVPSWF